MSASLEHVVQPGGPGVIDLGTREGSTFDIALRGYARDQVEERLQQWAMALDQAEYERDEALRALAEARALPKTEIEVASARLQEILRLATDEATDLRAQAKADAADIRTQAQDDARDDLQAAATERAVTTEEATRIIDAARTEAQRLLTEAHADARTATAAVEAEIERLRADAHNEVQRMLAGGRAEAAELDRLNAQARESAQADHDRIVADFRADEAATRDALHRELQDLEARRNRVQGDIAKLREALSGGLGSSDDTGPHDGFYDGSPADTRNDSDPYA